MTPGQLENYPRLERNAQSQTNFHLPRSHLEQKTKQDGNIAKYSPIFFCNDSWKLFSRPPVSLVRDSSRCKKIKNTTIKNK